MIQLSKNFRVRHKIAYFSFFSVYDHFFQFLARKLLIKNMLVSNKRKSYSVIKGLKEIAAMLVAQLESDENEKENRRMRKQKK